MEHTFLQGSDFVGITFWVVSIAMWAATLFFFYEGMRVSAKWRTSLVVAALITFIAAVHYMYMREFWVTFGESPIVYRYIDWVLTVPLQMVEFYLILIAAGAAVSGGSFWRLLVGTLVISGSYLMIINIFILSLFYAISAYKEEKYLINNFNYYKSYSKNTGMFIPRYKK